MKATIVVPTVRPESAREFLDAWMPQFHGHRVIVVEDGPSKSDLGSFQIEHYCWEDIDRDLGEASWIIPRRTDCVRSYGFYQATLSACDFIVSLDDDCFPITNDFLECHYSHLYDAVEQEAWTSTIDELRPRGMPYRETKRIRPCWINHGLWKGIPDCDAITQMRASRHPLRFEPKNQLIPSGLYFPMCGMNVAFRPEMAPAMYFLLMGRDYPYDRFGDIWCGIIAKRICDHLGVAVRSGEPYIEHRRASDMWQNLWKEYPGYAANEAFWRIVDSVSLHSADVAGCYAEVSRALAFRGVYEEQLRTAMLGWVKLFRSQEVSAVTSVDWLASRREIA